jgi:hypothetical protein
MSTTKIGALAVAVVFLGLISWRLARRRGKGRGRSLAVGSEGSLSPDAASLSPEQQMIARTEKIRGTLVSRFGPHWAAKTTEEIAGEVELAALVGPARMEQLVQFLRAADRVKFAAEVFLEDQGEDWDAWVAAFVAETAPAASATSRIKGR